MSRKITAYANVLTFVMFLLIGNANAISPAGKSIAWAKIKAGHDSIIRDTSKIPEGENVVLAAPAQYTGKIENGKYYPQPGHPGKAYIEYIRPMAGADGGIEVKLMYLGIIEGTQELGSVRLSVWTLHGYYAAGGSRRVLPDNLQYVSSIANEIRLHCNAVLNSFFWREIVWGLPQPLVDWLSRSANPVNIEAQDHPGYTLSKWQVIKDWSNYAF